MASEEGLSDRTSDRSCASDKNSKCNTEETSETEAIGETETSSTSSAKFRSDVWSYFTKCTNGKKVLCQLSNNGYAYHGVTSSLRNHLQRYHKDKYKPKVVSNGSQQSKMDFFLSCAKCPPTLGKRIMELIVLTVAKICDLLL